VLTRGGRATARSICSGTISGSCLTQQFPDRQGTLHGDRNLETMPPVRDRGRRRRNRLIALGVIVVVVAWGAVLAAKSWSAYRHDKAGLAELQSVRGDLAPGQLTEAATVKALDAARAEFAAAHSQLASPLFAPVTVLPVIGRQLQSVRDLSSAAQSVSEVGGTFLGQVHGVINEPHGAGPERIASLHQLGVLSLSAESQLARIQTGPSDALIGPLASKHDEFVSQLDDARSRLTKAAAVSAVVATILQGPKQYLVLASNNAEMRSGSGAFLEVGLATTGAGSVHVGDMVPSGSLTLPPGAVTVERDLERNWGWLRPGVDWRNLGVTPQFDVTGPLAAQMWHAGTGQQVDGVIALDVEALRQLLTVTGPVTLPSGQTIGSDNVVSYLLHDQYAGLTDNSSSSGRQDVLGSLTSAVLRELQGQSVDLHTLATAVTSAVDGRHLMLWSSDPKAQAAWEVSGVSGSLTPTSLAVAAVNRGGNKLDQYLPMHVVVHTAPSGSGTEVTLTTTLTNVTPPGLSQYVAGPYPGVPVAYGGYTGLVAANLPAAASGITMTGAGPLAAKSAEGPTWLVAAPITIPQGTTSTVVITFHLPGSHGTMHLVPSARIPAQQWTAEGSSFDDSTARTVSW
jgi:hypothetical protein